MRVRITDELRDIAKKSSKVRERLQALVARAEGWPDDTPWTNGEGCGPYRAFPVDRGSHMVIGKQAQVAGETAFLFLACWHRNETPWKHFSGAPIDEGKTRLEPMVKRELEAMRALLLAERSVDTSVPLPELPPELHLWLRPPRVRRSPDKRAALVFESHAWVEAIRREKTEAWAPYLRDELQLILDASDLDPLDPEELGCLGETFQGFPGAVLIEAKVGGLLAVILPAGHGGVGRRPIFLVAAYHRVPDTQTQLEQLEAVWPSIRAYRSEELLQNPQKALDAIASCARRCYPEHLVYDPELWRTIERDEEGNLALSAEEQTLLESVAMTGPTPKPLPLFLDGQAGSGKSTMLLHIFADYCESALDDLALAEDTEGGDEEPAFEPPTGLPIEGQPLFVTLSGKLLEEGRKAVAHLLRSGVDHVEQHQGLELQPHHVAHFFCSWKRLLESLVQGEAAADFVNTRYIDLARFRRLYLGQASADERGHAYSAVTRRHSPELVWFVIRSLIKGTRPHGFLDPSEFKSLDSAEQVVTFEVFKDIHQTIWSGWYKPLLDKGYWDLQDLARFLMNDGRELPGYPVIFCDEAQDFTRVELMLLLRLFAPLRYDLKRAQPTCLPMLLAGDPLQTLDPTGFRWDAVRSKFYEQLEHIDTGRGPIKPEYHRLRHNYRSTRAIVRFVNLLQAWRCRLFGDSQVEPQSCWHAQEGMPPRVWVLDDDPGGEQAALSPEDLKGELERANIIVPDDAGDGTAFVEQDAVLSKLLKKDQEGKYRNVYTPIGCKGLEFDQVILWRFGEHAPDGLLEASQGDDPRLRHQHFMNKLYVAASRAKRSLGAVDTSRGYERLWQKLEKEPPSDWPRMEGFDPGKWEGKTNRPSRGDRRTVDELQGGKNYKKTAEVLETTGLAERDPQLLRRAVWYFDLAGDIDAQERCLAAALNYEGSYAAAGALFLRLRPIRYEQASDAFWDGLCWAELSELYLAAPPRKKERYFIPRVMVARPEHLAGALESLRQARGSFTSRPSPNSAQWRALATRLAALTRSTPTDRLPRTAWDDLGELLGELTGAGFVDCAESAGLAWHKADKPGKAVEFWERADPRRDDELYLLTKARSLQPPESLSYLARAGHWSDIERAWEDADRPTDPRWVDPVVTAMEGRRAWEEAFEAALSAQLVERAWALRSNLGGSTAETRGRLLLLLHAGLLQDKRWSDAVSVSEQLRKLGDRGAERDYDLIASLVDARQRRLGLPADVRDKVDTLVRERVLKATRARRAHLTLEGGAAAVERFVRDKKLVLEFYEGLMKARDTQISHFAARRWIHRKRLWIADISDQKERGLETNRLETFIRKRPELKGLKKLPDYPEVSGAAKNRPKPLPASYELRYKPNLGKLTLVYLPTDSQLVVNARAFRVVAEELVVTEGPGFIDFEDGATGVKGSMQQSNPGVRVELAVGEWTRTWELS